MTIKDGGPAFPNRVVCLASNQATVKDEYLGGMTLRAYFAAHTSANDLASINVKEDQEALAGRSRPDGYPNGLDSIKFNLEVEAALCMLYADAKIAALEKAP